MPGTVRSTKSAPRKRVQSETVSWDAEVLQLGLRQRGAAQSWIVQWRQDGRSRKWTLGKAAEITCEVARRMARDLLAEAAETDFTVQPKTIAEFSVRYLADLAESWKPTTRRGNAHDVERHIVPGLGDIDLRNLTREDVVFWKSAIPGSEGTANRALATLSGMMRHAELLGLREPGSNPCAGLRRRKSGFKAAYLTEPQWAKLGKVLRNAAEDHPVEVAFLRFLALTGCRKGEALDLQWGMIDGSRWALPDAKSGPRAIWLGQPALRVLASLPAHNLYVFGAEEEPMILHRLDDVWNDVRRKAGIAQVRIHDLRHSFASVAVNDSVDLRTLGGLLGHSDLKTTEGYAHLEERTVTAASKRVGAHLAKVTKPVSRRVAFRLSIYGKFAASGQRLPVFCEEHGLEPKAFYKEVMRWRRMQPEAAS